MTTGIIFNGEMVRAILDGRKTQTRRVVKPPLHCRSTGCELTPGELSDREVNSVDTLCPYGGPGDRLWVRETFARFEQITVYRADCLNGNGVEDADSMRCRLDYKVKWRPSIFMPKWASRITLEIVSVRVERVQDITDDDAKAEGIEGRFHPDDPHLWTWKDYTTSAWAPQPRFHYGSSVTPVSTYEGLWDSINAKRGFGWATNPWIWRIEFKRIN